MIKLSRVCIPVGLDCNLQCKYCYRGLSVGGVPTEISPLMREYLSFIDKEWCQAVCISGGEPLLYMDLIKEIFSLVKSNVHKKIMSNGSLLTQELVDYINANRIEFWLSHDGDQTKHLRGIDVLDNLNVVKLVKQIKILSINSVITNVNCDIIANYNYIIDKLGRTNFFYVISPVYDNGYNSYLIDGFDYDTFARSCWEFQQNIQKDVPYYTTKFPVKQRNFNVDLNGNIVDKNTLKIYGTVLDNKDVCIKNLENAYKNGYCNRNVDCPIRDCCFACKEQASEHSCKCFKIIGGYA